MYIYTRCESDLHFHIVFTIRNGTHTYICTRVAYSYMYAHTCMCAHMACSFFSGVWKQLVFHTGFHRCFHTLFSYSVFIRCFHTLAWSLVFIRCFHTLFSYGFSNEEMLFQLVASVLPCLLVFCIFLWRFLVGLHLISAALHEIMILLLWGPSPIYEAQPRFAILCLLQFGWTSGMDFIGFYKVWVDFVCFFLWLRLF